MFEQLDTFLLLVNFSHELAHIMTTHDFLSAKHSHPIGGSDSEQCLNRLQLDLILCLVNF